jgi:3-oxoacyl-[acyl-carrier protein] reductase
VDGHDSGEQGAVIYGAGCPVSGELARALAREGARVFLAGRALKNPDAIATETRPQGGAVDATVVDARDEGTVDAFVGAVVVQTGQTDISCTVIRYGDTQESQMEISVNDMAAFVASDHARTLSATDLNISRGIIMD